VTVWAWTSVFSRACQQAWNAYTWELKPPGRDPFPFIFCPNTQRKKRRMAPRPKPSSTLGWRGTGLRPHMAYWYERNPGSHSRKLRGLFSLFLPVRRLLLQPQEPSCRVAVVVCWAACSIDINATASLQRLSGSDVVAPAKLTIESLASPIPCACFVLRFLCTSTGQSVRVGQRPQQGGGTRLNEAAGLSLCVARTERSWFPASSNVALCGMGPFVYSRGHVAKTHKTRKPMSPWPP